MNDLEKKIAQYVNDHSEIIFLVEYQMGPNDKCRTVSSQILYHISKYNSKKLLVGPSLKNMLNINGNPYSNFITKYKTNYAANKNHSKVNFMELLNILNGKHIIDHIKKGNIDDIADSVLMSLAWVMKNSILNIIE